MSLIAMRYRTWPVSHMRREFERENFREGGLVFHCTDTALSWSWGPAGLILGRLGEGNVSPVCGRTFRSKCYKRLGLFFVRDHPHPSWICLRRFTSHVLSRMLIPGRFLAYTSRRFGTHPTTRAGSHFVGQIPQFIACAVAELVSACSPGCRFVYGRFTISL